LQSSNVLRIFKAIEVGTATYGARTNYEECMRAVDESDAVVGLVPRRARNGYVWDAVSYARDRNVPVVVVLPNGQLEQYTKDKHG
jgi:hypothetical protein